MLTTFHHDTKKQQMTCATTKDSEQPPPSLIRVLVVCTNTYSESKKKTLKTLILYKLTFVLAEHVFFSCCISYSFVCATTSQIKRLSLQGCAEFAHARADPGRGAGGLDPSPPLKNHKRIGFLSNTGPDHLKI